MRDKAIRLDEKKAAEYGIRVLLPGTAEHAAYLRSRGTPVPQPEKVASRREPEPAEPGPIVSHEIAENGSWVVTRDDEFFADGDDPADIPQVVSLAEAGHDAFAPSGRHAEEDAADADDLKALENEGDGARETLEAMNMPDLRKLATKNDVSYGGLRKAELIDTLLSAGVGEKNGVEA